MENNGSLAVCLLLIYVFVFNNVRADCKTMFCLINEDESKTKNVTFVRSIHVPKAPMGRGWVGIHNVIRRFCTLWF